MDKEIVQKCREGDRNAQKVVFDSLFGKVYSVSKRYIGDREDVLEVVNTVFLTAFINIKQFEDKGDFEAWIRRITVNKSIDFLRVNKKLESPVEENDLVYLNKNVSYNEALEKLSIEVMDAMLNQLPSYWRSVFNMHAIEGYSHKEIAKILGISELMSRKYLSKARKQLQSLVKKNDSIFELNVNG
ncbi:MAG: RNA polymerase subunit sigma-24 [Crocinitomicaceae bacterium]|nr:RNA polymerase subunit sigma-24 [Crocinitomicaceae bacterium]|tara:strand:- start:5398 stop:5955 length:558 start_codon:yes stop_codon:yes gene_type:complete